jgi:tetratricopeptide (TPR) repeat protein
VDTGQPVAALESYRHALEIREKLAADNPLIPDFRDRLANTHSNAGEAQARIGQSAGALNSYRRALEIREKLAADNPERPDFQLGVGRDLNRIGEVSYATGRLPDAIAAFTRSASLHERLVNAQPTMTEFQIGLAGSVAGLGRAQRLARRPAEAVASLRRAVALRDRLPAALVEARYELARDHALLADLATIHGSGLSRDEGLAEAAKAMTALRQAVTAGFHDLSRLAGDAALDPLHARPDFQLLLLELAFPTDAFARQW